MLILLFGRLGVIESMAQGLFEKSLASGEDTWNLSGFVRGMAWYGKNTDRQTIEPVALYSDGEMNLTANPGKMAEAKISVRMRDALDGGFEPGGTELREAWIRLFSGPFSVTAGQQIVAWGKADLNNPTDIISPKNALFHSTDPDDMYLGNFMVNASLKPFPVLTLSGIWIPLYKPSVIPFSGSLMPDGLPLPTKDFPDFRLKNSNYAARIDVTLPVIDFTVSWFEGFDPLPMLVLQGFEQKDTSFVPLIGERPFRQSFIGSDFSATAGAFGFRGEIAYRMTKDYDIDDQIPRPDIKWVIGADRSFGDLNLILQYAGYHVFQLNEVAEPGGQLPLTPGQTILFYNRLMFRQNKQDQHELSLHASWQPGPRAIELEGLVSYNLSTREYLFRTRFGWNLPNGAMVNFGWQWLKGDDNTLFDLISPVMNGMYVQGKIHF